MACAMFVTGTKIVLWKKEVNMLLKSPLLKYFLSMLNHFSY